MRQILLSVAAVFCILLVGCDAGSSIDSLTGNSADVKLARNLFTRSQQHDQAANVELEQRAGKGDLAAAFFAGLVNDPAVGKGGDPTKAAAYYQAAASRYSGARHNLALLILQGVSKTASSPSQETALALRLLNEAANKDRLESMLMLASLYENGWTGIERNPALAAQWYERVVSFANDPRAVTRLGAAYQDGVGRSRDAQQAAMYLLVAAEAGQPEAQYRMARLEQNPVQIAQWLLVAAWNDVHYTEAAQDALTKLSPEDQLLARRKAELWRHAHDQRLKLTSFTSPVLEP